VIVGFAYEYAYEDHEYRTMNTKHAQCTLDTFGRSAGNCT